MPVRFRLISENLLRDKRQLEPLGDTDADGSLGKGRAGCSTKRIQVLTSTGLSLPSSLLGLGSGPVHQLVSTSPRLPQAKQAVAGVQPQPPMGCQGGPEPPAARGPSPIHQRAQAPALPSSAPKPASRFCRTMQPEPAGHSLTHQ